MLRSFFANKYGAFFLTFTSYVCFHATRKSFSTIKSTLVDDSFFEGYSSQQDEMAGLIDTLFLFFYSGGLYVSGMIGDRYDARSVLLFAQSVSGLAVMGFGIGGYAGVRSLALYAILWSFNGLVQSLGYPANFAVVGNWFGGGSEDGLVFGLWLSNSSVGNIVGTALVGAVQTACGGNKDYWKLAMVAAGALIFCDGVLMYFLLTPAPPEPLLREEEAHDPLEDPLIKRRSVRRITGGNSSAPSGDVPSSEDQQEQIPEASSAARPSQSVQSGISFCDAWRIPGVAAYALSYANLKSVSYAFLFWLPFYLTTQLSISSAKANSYSMLFDVGSILGGLLGGFILDRVQGYVGVIIVSFMLLASVCVWCFQHLSSLALLPWLLVVTGILLGGPGE
jgi:OPA family glycerol-3-phosphate transporter-like MFS transporter 3